MQRVTISMSDAFAEELEVFMARNGYDNRSEAVRDLARSGLERARTESAGPGQSLGALIYVYDHGVREIPKRLTDAYHRHHEISVATLHVHLDHHNCLEMSVLRGDSAVVKEFAGGVIAERGVRHGQIVFIPVDIEETAHSHRGVEPAITHTHVHPKG